MQSSSIDLRILGPLQITVGAPVTLRAAKQRSILAALILARGEPVSVADLIDTVWGTSPPAGARDTVYAYVMRLRKALPCGDVVVNADNGYALNVPIENTDIGRFDILTEQAASAQDASELEAEFSFLSEALSLWRGKALADIQSENLRHEFGAALQERRMAAMDRRFDVGLALGRHADLISDLTAATAANPLHERSWCQLMLALNRSGRQAEALEAYRRIGSILVDQLGVEPGPDLQGVHLAILRQHDQAPEQPSTDSVLPRPAQLPLDAEGFLGREDLLRRLEESAGADTRVTILSGVGGVGKTAVAVRWSHGAAEAFPDGQLFADMCGFDTDQAPREPARVLDAFIRALGISAERMPEDSFERESLYRSLLHDRKLLILLDNVRSAVQVLPLLPGAGGCRAVITSRYRLERLVIEAGATVIDVGMMSSDEATSLLRKQIGDGFAEEQLAAVAQRCDHLPLALRIAAARIAVDSGWRDQFLRPAPDERGRLDALTADEGAISVRSALDASCHAMERPLVRALAFLGLLPGLPFSASVAAAVLDVDVHRARELMTGLNGAQFVQHTADERYSMHDLVRSYARDLAGRELDAEECDDGKKRAIGYLLAVLGSAYHCMTGRPFDISFDGPVPAVPVFTDRSDALAWTAGERELLEMAIELSFQRGWHDATWQLAFMLNWFYDARGLWQNWQETSARGLEAAERSDDDRGVSLLQLQLGRIAFRARDVAGALQHQQAALQRSDWDTELKWAPTIQANCGVLFEHIGDWGQAENHYRAAYAAATTADDRWSLGFAQYQMARVHLHHENRAAAVAELLGVIDIARETAHPFLEPMAYCNLAELALEDGDRRRAEEYARRAGDAAGRLERLPELALSYKLLGEALHLDDRASAVNSWRRALDIYEWMDPASAEKVRRLMSDRSVSGPRA